MVLKKTIAILFSAMGMLSVHAQQIKVYENGDLLYTLTNDATHKYKIVMEPSSTTTGTATRTGDFSVSWVQLWANGPKFATYNIGAADNAATAGGTFYGWSDTDIATTQWGDNWRTPNEKELKDLIDKCTGTWYDNYNSTGVAGVLFTGKVSPYSSNSIFLPAAGIDTNKDGSADNTSNMCYYWSSVSNSDGTGMALILSSDVTGWYVSSRTYTYGMSVRPVLK